MIPLILAAPLLLSSPLNFESLKEEIANLQHNLETVPEEKKGGLYYQLAQASFRDQEVDKAFEYFLEALEATAEAAEPFEMGAEEKRLYEEALATYNAHSGVDPARQAHQLLEKFGPIAEKNPHYLFLNFILATADANLGNFGAFFERFYAAYPYLCNSFLAHKTKGVLYLRLARSARLNARREGFRQRAFAAFSQALECNEKDPGLYKVLIFLAKDEKNEGLLLSYLQKIVESGGPIPRGDVYLYVHEAVSLGEHVLAQQIIDRARDFYEFSRSITAAQEYLNQNKG